MWHSWESDSDDEDDARGSQRLPRIFRMRINTQFRTEYEFNERFRMTSSKMQELLVLVGHSLERDTNRSEALSVKLQLCIGLHWLGTGAQYHAVADMHGVSKASVCRTVHNIIHAIDANLFNCTVKWPSNIGEVISKFYNLAGMPLVVGCIDGTLIKIDAPQENEEHYVDRHGNHSVNCMAVCGPDGQFYYVSARWPGSVHDSRVLRNSSQIMSDNGKWMATNARIHITWGFWIPSFRLVTHAYGHRYPNDIEARKLWVKAAGRSNWQPTKYSRVCSEHFEAHCFKKKKAYNVMIKGSIPKLLLPLPISSPETVSVKQEPEWGGVGADVAALYAEHEVKEELVLGPEEVQPQDMAFAMQAKELSSAEEAPGVSCGPPVVLQYCYVRLERIRVDKDLYPCNICLKFFVFKSSFMTHTCHAKKRPRIIFKDIVDETSFPCNNCGKLFATETKLKTHVLIHTTGKEKLSCQISSDQVLHETGHQENNTENKPYTCDMCFSQFDQETNLTTHRLTHAVEKLYTCDICTKQFTRKSFLDTHHQLNHTGLHPYTCNICKKQFTQRSSLRRHRLSQHLAVHKKKKPHIPETYSCYTCDKHFLNVNNFTKHMSNHTVEKPHTCDICYKQFSGEIALNQHMVIHADGEPYTCDLCNKQFSVKYYLDTHRLIHTQKLTLYI